MKLAAYRFTLLRLRQSGGFEEKKNPSKDFPHTLISWVIGVRGSRVVEKKKFFFSTRGGLAIVANVVCEPPHIYRVE